MRVEVTNRKYSWSEDRMAVAVTLVITGTVFAVHTASGIVVVFCNLEQSSSLRLTGLRKRIL